MFLLDSEPLPFYLSFPQMFNSCRNKKTIKSLWGQNINQFGLKNRLLNMIWSELSLKINSLSPTVSSQHTYIKEKKESGVMCCKKDLKRHGILLFKCYMRNTALEIQNIGLRGQKWWNTGRIILSLYFKHYYSNVEHIEKVQKQSFKQLAARI